MNVLFQELKVLQMFLWNRVNYDVFMKAMLTVYPNKEDYIEGLWEGFRLDPIGFLVKRNEEDVYYYFINLIKTTGYKG